MSNENALNWKVLYVVEYYNFGLGCFSIRDTLKIQNQKNFKQKFHVLNSSNEKESTTKLQSTTTLVYNVSPSKVTWKKLKY